MNIEYYSNVENIDTEDLFTKGTVANNFRVSWSASTKGMVVTADKHAVVSIPVEEGKFYLYSLDAARAEVINLVSGTDEAVTEDSTSPHPVLLTNMTQYKTSNKNNTFIHVPIGSGVKFIVLNIKTSSVSWENSTRVQELDVSLISIASIDGVSIDIKKKFVNIFSNSLIAKRDFNYFNKETDIKRNAYIKTGTGYITNSSATSSAFLSVIEGEEYLINFANMDVTRENLISFFDRDKTELIESGAYNIPNVAIAKHAILYDDFGNQWIHFKVPEGLNVKCMATNLGLAIFNITSEFVVVKGSNAVIDTKIIDITDNELFSRLPTNYIYPNLNGKTWVAYGDSITEANFRSLQRYHDYIRVKCEDLKVINLGISGSGYCSRHDLSDLPENVPDILTIFLGTNDFGQIGIAKGLPLGYFMDKGTHSVSGYMRKFFENLIDKYHSTKIGIITPLPRFDGLGINFPNNSAGYNLEDLVDMIKKYCNFYSIPCLDLYNSSNLYMTSIKGRELYFKSPTSDFNDGLHPNDAGHYKISNYIGNFVNSL